MVSRLAKERVDGILDLQAVPPTEQWPRIESAVSRLAGERGGSWTLKILLRDTPEAAGALPVLVAQLGRAGLRHDATREPGGVQGVIVTPASRFPMALAA